MAKSDKKADPTKGLLILQLSTFKTACKRALAERNDISKLDVEVRRTFSKETWHVQGTNEPLELGGRPSFYLGDKFKSYRCTCSFELKQYGPQSYLEQLFLHVYKVPLPRAGNSTMLVRAEWDFRKTAEARHAQPHWHVQMERKYLQEAPAQFLEQGKESLGSFGEGTFKEFASPEMDSNEAEPHPSWRIHLAMAASWHVEKHGHQSIFIDSDKEFLLWLGAVTRYLRDQIEYSEAKA